MFGTSHGPSSPLLDGKPLGPDAMLDAEQPARRTRVSPKTDVASRLNMLVRLGAAGSGRQEVACTERGRTAPDQ